MDSDNGVSPSLKCLCCDKKLSRRKPWQRFCSTACRAAAYRKRRKEAESRLDPDDCAYGVSLTSFDTAYGHEARKALAWKGLYITRDIGDDPGNDAYEENLRASLPFYIAMLDRTDLVVIHRLARLFALVERDPRVFEIAAKAYC